MIFNDGDVYERMNIDAGLAVFELGNYFENEEWLRHFSKNDNYGIIWSGTKKMNHIINGKEILIPKNNFLFVAPNVKQQFIKQTSKSDAYYIVFKHEFYSKSIAENLKLENSILFSTDQINVVENNICSAPIFESNYIKYFFRNFDTDLDAKLAHNLLERIILDGQMQTFDSNQQLINDDYDVEIATKFKKLLQQNVNDYKQVSFYIDRLFVTKRRLDKATLIIFKKSAKEMIIDELMKNAKIMLANSKMSIKDIALELNFLQETNFTAFFKKNTGLSPSKFRQNTPN
ncbi:AraC-type DNA-binding protein [Algoriella xinjiangensis]|uniref:AraC-type DNA-binding protein n=1 Tax=Algoriella xinjiangensis TaxID=684065 RepID=A0A1I4U571_9FLAO|nr:helix-turn-helix domain-containing protein [Algoriella xinjiangensis]SFM84178.1 AraC-type DNA-binding protein [Algoriella xinjiangensis]VDH16487.1 DNA-binding transcriptional regulator AraC [Algoriella xinjiangensis]VDH17855.1 DNA-binding transcriptional regulator AraC [Algoriella xinjiangensis]